MKAVIRFVASYLVLSAVLLGLTLVQAFPARPTSAVGWVALLVLIIPITCACELLGEFLFRNRLSQSVERHTRHSSFSWLRIGYVLLLALVVCAAVVALIQWISLGA